MGKYRKKPVVVEARQFTPTEDSSGNGVKLAEWCDGLVGGQITPDSDEPPIYWIEIPTIEGTMRADAGWWIIQGVQGEFYPCKPDIFEVTYEPVGDSHDHAPFEITWDES